MRGGTRLGDVGDAQLAARAKGTGDRVGTVLAGREVEGRGRWIVVGLRREGEIAQHALLGDRQVAGDTHGLGRDIGRQVEGMKAGHLEGRGHLVVDLPGDPEIDPGVQHAVRREGHVDGAARRHDAEGDRVPRRAWRRTPDDDTDDRAYERDRARCRHQCRSGDRPTGPESV